MHTCSPCCLCLFHSDTKEEKLTWRELKRDTRRANTRSPKALYRLFFSGTMKYQYLRYFMQDWYNQKIEIPQLKFIAIFKASGLKIFPLCFLNLAWLTWAVLQKKILFQVVPYPVLGRRSTGKASDLVIFKDRPINDHLNWELSTRLMRLFKILN